MARQYKQTRTALAPSQVKNHDLHLKDEEIMRVIGWVVSQVRQGHRVFYLDVHEKIKEWYDIDFSLSTVGNYCARNGISLKKVCTKGSDACFTEHEVLGVLQKELILLHSLGYLDQDMVDRSNLVMVYYISNTVFHRPDFALGLTGITIAFFQKTYKTLVRDTPDEIRSFAEVRVHLCVFGC